MKVLGDNHGHVELVSSEHIDGRDKIVLRQYQDVEPILENNARLRNAAPENPYRGREFVRTASIPLNFILMWAQEAGLDWSSPTIWRDLEVVIVKKKQSPDWEKVRTVPRKWRR